MVKTWYDILATSPWITPKELKDAKTWREVGALENKHYQREKDFNTLVKEHFEEGTLDPPIKHRDTQCKDPE
jgi:hypothetical protein